MNEEVRLPIVTTVNGFTTQKVVVEDVYKMSNRIIEASTRCYNKIMDIINSIHKTYTDPEGDEYEGELIIGTGTSTPCEGDLYDDKIGNEIAFKKAKLKANMQKFKKLIQVAKALDALHSVVWKEIDKVTYLTNMDIEALKEYNPNFSYEY